MICLLPHLGASEAVASQRWGRWVCCTPRRKENSMGWTKRRGGRRGRHPIASASSNKTFTGIARITSTRQKGTKSTMAMTAVFEEVRSGEQGRAVAARPITWSLDNKRSCSMMLWTFLTMGNSTPPPPSLPLLLARVKPLHLCNVMLRMSLAAMQLWDLCTVVRGDRWGAECVVYCCSWWCYYCWWWRTWWWLS